MLRDGRLLYITEIRILCAAAKYDQMHPTACMMALTDESDLQLVLALHRRCTRVEASKVPKLRSHLHSSERGVIQRGNPAAPPAAAKGYQTPGFSRMGTAPRGLMPLCLSCASDEKPCLNLLAKLLDNQSEAVHKCRAPSSPLGKGSGASSAEQDGVVGQREPGVHKRAAGVEFAQVAEVVLAHLVLQRPDR
jgi:hypothetical protein